MLEKLAAMMLTPKSNGKQQPMTPLRKAVVDLSMDVTMEAGLPGTVRAMFEQIAPGVTDRLLAVGATGSGKSTLVEKFARLRNYVVVHDGKGLVKWPGYVVCNSLKQVEKHADAKQFPRLIYRPGREEKHDEAAKQDFFEWIYSRGNTTLVVDEVFQIVQGNNLPESYLACLTSGREHKVEVWNCCQRPTRIPSEILSEAVHLYCFRLRLPRDRDKLADMTGLEYSRIAQLPKREFFYVPEEGEPMGPMRLTI